ncbi:MAG: ABC transporter permease subunit [Actinomycetota bacterium]|nr:ABC transporter permease subunit [Actinomycetota bacterium]
MPAAVPGDPIVSDALDEGPPTAPTGMAPPSVGRPNARFARLLPNLVLVVAAIFFIMPLLALARFALQNVPTVLLGWDTLFDKWSLEPLGRAFEDPVFWDSLRLSLKLALGTVLLTLLLLLPTAIWVHLRLPRARPVIEFVTVLPYMIPAIALVAGIKLVKPHARWFLDSDLSLIPFYVVLALPFTYRSIDAGLRAIDLRTLVDASRSLGSGWLATIMRVLIPNLRTAIISASFLTAAVVIGEYTIARLLLIDSLPPYQRILVGTDSQAGYGLNLMALLATTSLFVLVSVLTKKRDRKRKSFAYAAARAASSQEPAAA